jgi:hypothetical protein
MSVNNYICPLRMSDGRSMTDYRPKCIVNYDLMEQIGEKNVVKSSYESRMYLQKNADDIMKKEFEKSKNNIIPCIKCKDPINDIQIMPEKYYVTCDAVSCTKKLFNENGLGTRVINDT